MLAITLMISLCHCGQLLDNSSLPNCFNLATSHGFWVRTSRLWTLTIPPIIFYCIEPTSWTVLQRPLQGPVSLFWPLCVDMLNRRCYMGHHTLPIAVPSAFCIFFSHYHFNLLTWMHNEHTWYRIGSNLRRWRCGTLQWCVLPCGCSLNGLFDVMGNYCAVHSIAEPGRNTNSVAWG